MPFRPFKWITHCKPWQLSKPTSHKCGSCRTSTWTGAGCDISFYGVYSFGVMPPAVVPRCRSCHFDWRERHNTGAEIEVSSKQLPAGLISRRWGEVGDFEATEYSRQLLKGLDAAVDAVGGWEEGGVSLSLMGDVFHSSTTAKELAPPCVSQLRSWVHLVRGDIGRSSLLRRGPLMRLSLSWSGGWRRRQRDFL